MSCRTVADAILHDSTPVHVHFVMFVPALMGHANEEQQAKWLSDALTMKIIGSYAQTELGHGKLLEFVQSLPIFPYIAKYRQACPGLTANGEKESRQVFKQTELSLRHRYARCLSRVSTIADFNYCLT